MAVFIIRSMNALFLRNWNKQIRKGLLELAILNDIHNRGMYAYEIERKFRKSQGLFLSRGAIYNILKRFKQQRLVSISVTKSPDGPKRKYYQLTAAGRDALRAHGAVVAAPDDAGQADAPLPRRGEGPIDGVLVVVLADHGGGGLPGTGRR